jgi:predicted transcriptional regulator
MAEDERHSKIQDIMSRLDKSKSYISKYRERLITSGVIKPVGHGILSFTYPYLNEFIQKYTHSGYY